MKQKRQIMKRKERGTQSLSAAVAEHAKLLSQTTKRKERVTLSLSADMVERLRTVVYWSPKLTLTGVVESAIQSTLKKLEKGKRFKKRKGKLPVGRPRKDLSS